MTLVAYISGHGFGHFTRSEAVLSKVGGVHLRTDERALVLARRASWAASVGVVDTGPGVIQRGPVELDLDATIVELERYLAGWDALVETEARFLREVGATAVYVDVPPVGFAAAARAGVRSIGMANFSWSWIYGGYGARFERYAAFFGKAEGEAHRFLALPLSGGLDHFPGRLDIPLVARSNTCSRGEGRGLLPVPASEKRPVVLLSFGGFGDGLDLGEAARRNPRYFFVAFSNVAARENLVSLAHDHGLPHQDLVLGADAILGKPGYGTVAEAIVARRAFVYCPRGDFREYPVLVRALHQHLPCAAISLDDLRAGNWSSALDQALAAPVPPATLTTDGAEVAAREVRALLG